jgi:hypothetical protein
VPPEPGVPPPGSSPPGGSQRTGPKKPPPGLRAQLTSTIQAAKALAFAHVDLAKTEAGAIAGEAGRVAALVGLAIVLVIFAIFLLVIGLSLGIGEWVFGSMGWGVVHGVELFISIALAAILVALGVSGRRIVGALIAGIVIGVLVGIALALNLPNQLYAAIGDATGMAVDPGTRPLVIGVLVWMFAGLIAGLFVVVNMSASAGGRFVALAGLIVFGAAFGAFTAITFQTQIGAAIGVTVGYLAWIGLMALDVSRSGIDAETIKQRFTPVQSIDAGKETLEWLQKRMPPGIGS